RGRHGEADARVAARRLDDRAAGLEHAATLGVVDHGDADPVFHAAARIARLHLGEHDRPARFRQAVEPHHRRVTNELEHGRRDLHDLITMIGDLFEKHLRPEGWFQIWYIGRTLAR